MIADKPLVTILPVTDIRRALSFYQEKLGLKVNRTSDTDAELQAGGNTMLYLYQREPFTVDLAEKAA